MKRNWLIVLVFVGGCGSVTAVEDADDGAAVVDTAVGVKPEVKPETSPGRQLGAGCTLDAQCGSGICVDGVCCNGRLNECSACVGGYLTSKPDGVLCGAETCTGTTGASGTQPNVATRHVCKAGACAVDVQDCTTSFTCTDGTTVDCGVAGFCTPNGSPEGGPAPGAFCICNTPGGFKYCKG